MRLVVYSSLRASKDTVRSFRCASFSKEMESVKLLSRADAEAAATLPPGRPSFHYLRRRQSLRH